MKISNIGDPKQNALHRAGGFGMEGVRYSKVSLDENEIEILRNEWKAFVDYGMPTYPNHFNGRGIVICAGGLKYFTCAWINIHLLRHNNCSLPIELWHNHGELNEEVIEELGKLGVVCKNTRQYGNTDFSTYDIKPFAIINSSFKEVLFLDADNNCMADPTYLFNCPQYVRNGALFWPDFWKTAVDNPIWKIVRSCDYQEQEQESGQMVVDKEKCWTALNLCLFFNQKKDIYYQFLLGDKDTFKFAWKAVNQPYAMISFATGHCGYANVENQLFRAGVAMVQHDSNGKVLFIHQNLAKWHIVKDHEYLWHFIKRFTVDANERRYLQTEVKFINGGKGIVFDIEGDVEIISCDQKIKENEEFCLTVLRNLRAAAFYHRFILYLYISRSRQEI